MDLSQPQKGEFGAEFRFSDLYVWAIRGQFTGWIGIQGEVGDIRAVFQNGAPKSVTGTGVRAHHLGSLLVEIGLCSQSVIDQVTQVQLAKPVQDRALLGEMLLAEGAMTPVALQNGLVHQTTRRFAELFKIEKGGWTSDPRIHPQLAPYGQAMNGASLLIPAIRMHASDDELKTVSEQLGDWALKLNCSLAEARVYGSSEREEPLLKLLIQPRMLAELEAFVGDARTVRALIRALILCEMVEPADASLARPPTKEAANAPEALPMNALTELPPPAPPTPMAFSGDSAPDVFSSISSTFPTFDNAPLYSDQSDPSMPIDPTLAKSTAPPPISSPFSSSGEFALPQTDASQSILGTIGKSPRTGATPPQNRIPKRPSHRPPRMGNLGRVRTSVRRRHDVPVHMKLVVDELAALHDKVLAGDPYDLLGVGPDASIDEVKKRHRKLASRFNPEILSSQLPEDLATMAQEVSQALNEAKEQVTQPKSSKSKKPEPKSEEDKASAAAQEEEMTRRFKMGQVLLNQRQYGQAREHFEFCMERDRYSGLYRAYYGWALYSDPDERANGGAEKAYEVIREASLLDQNEPIIQVYFGQLLRERGDLSHAATVLRRVLRSDPGNAAARRELNAIKAQDPSIRVDGAEEESSSKPKKGLFGR